MDYFGSIFSRKEPAHPGPCNHGSFSPTFDETRPGSIMSFGGGDQGQSYGTFPGRGLGLGSTTEAFGPEDGENSKGNGKGVRGSGETTGESVEGGSTGGGSSRRGWVGDAVSAMGSKKMKTTSWIAERHGITNMRSMYVFPYPTILTNFNNKNTNNNYANDIN